MTDGGAVERLSRAPPRCQACEASADFPYLPHTHPRVVRHLRRSPIGILGAQPSVLGGNFSFTVTSISACVSR